MMSTATHTYLMTNDLVGRHGAKLEAASLQEAIRKVAGDRALTVPSPEGDWIRSIAVVLERESCVAHCDEEEHHLERSDCPFCWVGVVELDAPPTAAPPVAPPDLGGGGPVLEDSRVEYIPVFIRADLYDRLRELEPNEDPEGMPSYTDSEGTLCNRCGREAWSVWRETKENAEGAFDEICNQCHEDEREEARRRAEPEIPGSPPELIERFRLVAWETITCTYQQCAREGRHVKGESEALYCDLHALADGVRAPFTESDRELGSFRGQHGKILCGLPFCYALGVNVRAAGQVVVCDSHVEYYRS